MEKKAIQKSSPMNPKKKFILIGLGTAFTGILGYFGWQWWSNRKAKQEEAENDPADSNNKITPSAFPYPLSPSRNDAFPLSKGSRGEKVKILQNALLVKYGKSTLPKYGADGDFGTELVSALKKFSLPESIDESTFNVLTKGNTINAKEVANLLSKAISSKNFNQVLFTLRGMKSTDDYSTVNAVFKTSPTGSVRKTLVNGLLDSFPDDNQKQQIRLELTRMGLRYDGKTWSLAGIEPTEIITKYPTTIWEKGGLEFSVKENTVLGWALGKKKGSICFITGKNRMMGVLENHVAPFTSPSENISGIEDIKENDSVSTSGKTLVFSSNGSVSALPPGILLGKFSLRQNGMAYIKTANGLVMTKEESIEKSNS